LYAVGSGDASLKIQKGQVQARPSQYRIRELRFYNPQWLEPVRRLVAYFYTYPGMSPVGTNSKCETDA
jgi:hypothetical protein